MDGGRRGGGALPPAAAGMGGAMASGTSGGVSGGKKTPGGLFEFGPLRKKFEKKGKSCKDRLTVGEIHGIMSKLTISREG